MKQFFFLTIFFAFASTATIAQTEPVAQNIKATVVADNLNLTWNDAKASEQASWEVQASVDGKTFSTIGFVWGAMPGENGNSYAFKQKTKKIQANYQYFRVLYMAEANNAIASNTVKLTK